MPKISVVIPSYNVSSLIGQTLDSVLANRADMEIVVIDDASTDNTCEIVEQYAARHESIRLMRSDANAGPGVARNRALETISGEYCLFHDADDILNEGAIDTVLALMDETNVDIAVFRYSLLRSVGGSPEEMSDSKVIWDGVVGEKDTMMVELDAAPQFLLTVNYPWNKIYRTSFVRRTNLRFSPARINEDILPHWASYMSAGRFLAINRSLTVHRLIPGRDQHTSVNDERRLEILKAFKDAESCLRITSSSGRNTSTCSCSSRQGCCAGRFQTCARNCTASSARWWAIPIRASRMRTSTASTSSCRTSPCPATG